MKIKELQNKGIEELNKNKIEDANIKVKILLMHVLNVSKEYIFIYQDEEVTNESVIKFYDGIERICKNEPIQYIINYQEFYGLDFYVDKNVLIPQPDTEILVDEVIKIITNKFNNNMVKVLDICTGSGAIGITLAKKIKNIEITLSDISEKALKIAEKNAISNGLNLEFIKSNLFNKIMIKEFDVIVSNPPYIESNLIKNLSQDVQKEPRIALDGGIDGLDFYRKISNDSKKYLKKDGYLALEIGYNQKKSVISILQENNYKNIYCKKDYGGNDRVVIAQK